MGGRVEQGEQGEQDMGVDTWAALAQSHDMSREFYIVQKGHREFLKLLETVEQAKMEQVQARRSFLVELGKCIDTSARLVKTALFPGTARAAVAVTDKAAESAKSLLKATAAVADKAAESAKSDKAAESAKSLLKATAAVADKAAESAKSLLNVETAPTVLKAAPVPPAEPKAAPVPIAESKASVSKASVSKAARVPCAAITKGGKGHACPHKCEPDQTFCKKHKNHAAKRPRLVIEDDDDLDDDEVIAKKTKKPIDLSDDSEDISGTDSEDEFINPHLYTHRKWVDEDQ